MEFKTRPTAIDLAAIYDAIQKPVKHRHDKGVYEHFDLTRVVGWELQDMKDGEEKRKALLQALQYSYAIDITDFAIPCKEGYRGLFELPLKKCIWKLLKFYTFRLFYQQREWNSQVQLALQYLELYYEPRIQKLEQALAGCVSSEGQPS